MSEKSLYIKRSSDAGYDLMVNLTNTSYNSNSLGKFLDSYLNKNLNFYSKYLPKMYLDGEYQGEITDRKAVTKYLSNDKFVLLPPLRVGHPELSQELIEFSNTELVPTRFDFKAPDEDKLQFMLKSHPELNYGGFVYPRSGLGTGHQIAISNNVGVIDSTYIGNCKTGLENRGRDFHMFTNGARIAQLVIGVIIKDAYNLAEENTERGEEGFGSSGVA